MWLLSFNKLTRIADANAWVNSGVSGVVHNFNLNQED